MNKIPTGEALASVIRQAVQAKIDTGRAKTLAEMGRAIGVTSAAISYWTKTGKVKEDRMEPLIRYFKDVTKPEDWGLEQWPGWAEKPTVTKKWFDVSASKAVWARMAEELGDDEFLKAYFASTRKEPREEWMELFDKADEESQQKALKVARIILK